MLTIGSNAIQTNKFCAVCNIRSNRLKKNKCENCYQRSRGFQIHINSPLIECACGCGKQMHSLGRNGTSVRFIKNHKSKNNINKKLCVDCKKENTKLVKLRCSTCYNRYILNLKPKKNCECGHCLQLIPITDKKGNPRKYASGHATKGKIYDKKHSIKLKRIYKPQKNIMSSKSEKIVQLELDKYDILYSVQRGIRLDEFIHPVDIFIPPNYCIEIDGEKWHTQLISQNKKRIPLYQNFLIDYQLEKRGYIVRRYWDSDVKQNLIWVMDQIFKTIGKNYRTNDMIDCKCGCGQQRRKYDSQGNLRFFISGHQNIPKDMSGRKCLLCGTKYASGYSYSKGDWIVYSTGFICTVCYRKQRLKEKRWLDGIIL